MPRPAALLSRVAQSTIERRFSSDVSLFSSFRIRGIQPSTVSSSQWGWRGGKDGETTRAKDDATRMRTQNRRKTQTRKQHGIDQIYETTDERKYTRPHTLPHTLPSSRELRGFVQFRVASCHLVRYQSFRRRTEGLSSGDLLLGVGRIGLGFNGWTMFSPFAQRLWRVNEAACEVFCCCIRCYPIVPLPRPLSVFVGDESASILTHLVDPTHL